jgi:hypothetical protein
VVAKSDVVFLVIIIRIDESHGKKILYIRKSSIFNNDADAE